MGGTFTHLDRHGAARMVKVSLKDESHRVAVAESVIVAKKKTIASLKNSDLAKGDALPIARIAAIAATKKTDQLIPLCHPLRITSVDVSFEFSPSSVRTIVTVECFDRSGVEMEALAGAAASALTLYDMCKAIDRGMEIQSLRLLSKSGGRSGRWTRG